MRLFWLAALFICLASALFAEGYQVEIVGLEKKQLLKVFKEKSGSLALKDKALPSLSVLKRRAQNDQEKFTELAKAYGYYSAKISYNVLFGTPPTVTFQVDLGPQYILSDFLIEAVDHTESLEGIQLKDIKIATGKPIDNAQIVEAEKSLVWQLRKKGYACTQILKKECIAYTASHTLEVKLYVSPGALMHFGPTNILGNQNVLPSTIEKNITWKEGAIFNPLEIEQTQSRLEKSGLYSSVMITEDLEHISADQVPIQIHVQESKHHSIGAGIAYTTYYGPGIKAEWDNKNLRGTGEKLSFLTELWERYQTVMLSLTKPHFGKLNQDLVWVAEYEKLKTVAFDSISYNATALLQQRINSHLETSRGLRIEWLKSHNFEGHHLYHLVKTPLQFKWSSANNLLDPTQGQTVNIKLTPTVNFMEPRFFYAIQNSSLAGYHSFFTNRLTLAAKLVIGNIIGAARHTIPPPDRFYGGSENVLRGYRAYTVSPLRHHRIPIGGRSLLAASLEARVRTQGSLGWVLFYDVGNVFSTNVPELRLKQLQSVGTGIRYATPIGPLRFDIAVPLARRRDIDPPFQIYFSIGQSF